MEAVGTSRVLAMEAADHPTTPHSRDLQFASLEATQEKVLGWGRGKCGNQHEVHAQHRGRGGASSRLRVKRHVNGNALMRVHTHVRMLYFILYTHAHALHDCIKCKV